MGSALPVGTDADRAPHAPPLRLLWLIDSLTAGGAEGLTLAFARAVDSRRIALTICARATVEGNLLESEARAAGFPIVNLGARRLLDLRAFGRLRRLLRDGRFDIVHAHLTYASIWGAVAGRLEGVPVVCTVHVSPPGRPPLKERLRQWLLRLLAARDAAQCVAVSRDLARELEERWRLRSGSVVIAHNGIAVDERLQRNQESHQRLCAELRLPPDATIVFTAAVLREGKGIGSLVEAARTVADEHPTARFVIAGDGPRREAWTRLAAERNVAHLFRWIGFRRDLDDLLPGADVFVLPTMADAFPTVLLEAMAAALPVVASDVGGIPEIVVQGETGILVPPGDGVALARAINRALSDPSWRAEAGRRGRERVEAAFSVGRWVEQLCAVYQDVRRRSA